MSRADCLAVAHASAVSRLGGMGLTEFRAACEGWEAIPVTVGGRLLGAVLRRGAHLHACILPEGFGLWCGKPMLRLIASTMAAHGRAVTSITAGNAAGTAFVERLGFVRSGQVDQTIFYSKESHHGH